MVRAKGTTLKAMQFKMKQEGAITNNGGAGGESSSFRLQLYYGDASAGSVPFMWESHPGTPKHPTTEYYSSLPPLTPPPAFNQNDYNNSTSLRTLFLAASNGKSNTSSPSSKMSTSLRSLFLASGSRRCHVATTTSPPSYTSLSSYSLSSTPMNKGQEENEFIRRRHGGVMEDGDGDEKRVGGGGGLLTSTLCFGGGSFMKVNRMKKVKNALMSIGRHGKTKNIN